jgi:cysteine desulfuration protein SufE
MLDFGAIVGLHNLVGIMSLFEKREELVATLTAINDSQERFAWLLARGKAQVPMLAELKTAANQVEGCLSKLWFVAEYRDGRCYFKSDSDSLIAKGIAGLLCDFYSGSHPREILKIDPSFLGQVGISQHLTPNRRNSVSKVWTKIHTFADDCLETSSRESCSSLAS